MNKQHAAERIVGVILLGLLQCLNRWALRLRQTCTNTHKRMCIHTHRHTHVHTLSIIQEKVADMSGNALRESPWKKMAVTERENRDRGKDRDRGRKSKCGRERKESRRNGNETEMMTEKWGQSVCDKETLRETNRRKIDRKEAIYLHQLDLCVCVCSSKNI